MANGDQLLLALDCGTQSMRALLFAPDGRLIAGRQVAYQPYTVPKPGWAEVDPEVFWSALCEATQGALRGATAGGTPAAGGGLSLASRVAAVSVTTQRDTLICMDRTGGALRPAISWLDTRKDTGFYRPGFFGRLGYRAIGMYEALLRSMADGKVNWIRRNEPEIWERTWKVVQVSGFLTYRLTGEIADAVSSMVGHVPMDYRRRRWATGNDLTARLFPVEEEKRYPLVEAGTEIGRITAAAAAVTGIPAGTPVIASGSDKACETLGMGVVDESMASFSFGTTATVELASRRYFEPMVFMPAYCAAMPGVYNPEIEIYRGYWMIQWFIVELGHRELSRADRTGEIPEDILDELLDATPPGSLGLMLQPYWGPGLKNPHARGAMIGFGDTHNRAAMYRAVVEGLAYGLRDGLERLEWRRGARQVGRIAAAGGASRNSRICRITADVLGRPLVRGETHEASGLGAAICAAVGAGIHGSFDTALSAMVRYADVFEPDPDTHAVYDDLFSVYRRIYPQLEPLYKRLREITGYPE